MNIFSRYLMRNIFIGSVAAAGLLLPLFTTFNLINELEDVSSHGYRWTQAIQVVLMTMPRTLIDIGPFIALLGGIVGLGQLSKSLELTAIRSAGVSIFRIATVVLCAGLLMSILLGVVDEWVASPLQQQALRLKNVAMVKSDKTDDVGNVLWSRDNDTFVTIKSLDQNNQPEGVEIFHYRPDLSIYYYIYASNATIRNQQLWVLHDVMQKKWVDGQASIRQFDNLNWKSIFSVQNLQELMMPASSFSVEQLNRYIHYLQDSGQPNIEFKIALWQKLGQLILILAMIVLAVPFTFSGPRSPSVGNRLAIGVIVGLLTYVIYKVVLNLGLLFSLNAPLTALVPPVLLLLMALGVVKRFDRRH